MRLSLAASCLAVASALPLAERQAGPTDPQILNYALTLEYLESTFYNLTLQKFSQEDFEKAGLRRNFYNNLQEIAYDEATHVSFLSGALQAANYQPVAACTYNFNFNTVQEFLQLASVLEGVGVSAYLGAAQYISNKAYLTAAGSILTVESRHSAYLRDNQIPHQSPFPAPFDIPLDFDEVYSLASQFIVTCPASNPALPVKAFPALALTSKSPASAGQTVTVQPASAVTATNAFFITAMGPVPATLTASGSSYQVVVPTGVQSGQEYLVLTSNSMNPTDGNIVAGPAIVPIVDNDTGANSGWEHGHQWGWGGWWSNENGNWQKDS